MSKLIYAIIGGGITSLIMSSFPVELNEVTTADLNGDGITDIVLNQDRGPHHYELLIPLYGVKEDDSVEYVTAETMKEMFPESTFDYSAVSDSLNNN